MSTPAEVEAQIKNQFTVTQDELVECPLMRQLTKSERLSIVSLCFARRPNQQHTVIFITDQDEVYGLGENGYDCNILAMKDRHWRCDRVSRPVKIKRLSNRRIATICIGGAVAAALDIYGNLCWWGLDHTWTSPPEMRLPEKDLNSSDHFTAVSCGQNIVAGIHEDGSVWCFGKSFSQIAPKKRAVALSCGVSHLAFCTDTGEVYTSGSGTHGQLGFFWNHQRESNKQRSLHFSNATKIELDEPCTDVVCGLNSTICLTASGKLWACGANSGVWGYLGTARKDPFLFVPEQILIDEEVVKVLAFHEGLEFTSYAALTKSGWVAWGSECNVKKKLDTRTDLIAPHDKMLYVKKSSDVPSPFLSCSVKEKLEVINSLIHDIRRDMESLETLAKTEQDDDCPGKAPSELCQWRLFGTLTGAVLDKIRSFVVFQPQPDESQFGIIYVTFDNEVYGLGYNGYESNLLGLTGSDYRATKVYSPVKIEDLSGKDVRVISVGECIGAVIDVNSNLFWWGRCAEDDEEVMPPSPITKKRLLFSQVVCGRRFLAALDVEQKVYVWGQLVEGGEWLYQQRIPAYERIVSISAGRSHLIMLNDKGDVFSWGCNDQGQRGYPIEGSENDIYQVKQIQFHQVCKEVACGLTSTLLLSSSGDVWACGGNPESYGYVVSPENDLEHVTKCEKLPLQSKMSTIKVAWGWHQGKYQSIYEATSTEGKRYIWDDYSPPVEPSSKPPSKSVFFGHVSPKSEPFYVAHPPHKNIIRPCDCRKSSEISRITESMQGKLDAINEIVTEILNDIQSVKENEQVSLEAQLMAAHEMIKSLKKPKATISNQAGDGYITDEEWNPKTPQG